MTDLEAAEFRVRQEDRAYPAERSAWSIPLLDCAVRVFDAKDRVIAALRAECVILRQTESNPRYWKTRAERYVDQIIDRAQG